MRPRHLAAARGRVVSGASVEFVHDAKGDVSGYGIWFDWEWNVRFARRDPQ
jgi:hypothetical protein